MARRTLEERLGGLEARRAELEEKAAPQPTEVHRQTVDVLAHLLDMGRTFSGAEVPTHLRVLLRTLEGARPVLEAELAKVPEDQIVQFMGMIRDEIDNIITAAPQAASEEEKTA